MAAVVDLKVTPDQLKQKSQEVSEAIIQMKTDFARLNAAISATHSYWIGQAGEAHRKLYLNQTGEVDEILKQLGEYPTDLLKMAGIYTNAEITNKVAAATLRSNVIH